MSERKQKILRYSDYRPPVIVPFQEDEAARRYYRSARKKAALTRTSSGASASTSSSNLTSSPSELIITPLKDVVFQFSSSSPTLATAGCTVLDGAPCLQLSLEMGEEKDDCAFERSGLHNADASTLSSESRDNVASRGVTTSSNSIVNDVGGSPEKVRTIPPFSAMDELRAMSGVPITYCPTGQNLDHLFEGFSGLSCGETEAEEEDVADVEKQILTSCEGITSDLRRLREAEAEKGKMVARRREKFAMLRKEMNV